MALSLKFGVYLGVLAVIAVGCSSGGKTTGTTSAATAGTSGGTTTSGTTSGSGSSTGSGTTSGGPGACGTDLDCATAHGICGCGTARGPCADGGGVCKSTADTCQPRNLGADCSNFPTDCEDGFGDLLCYCHSDSTVDAGGLCYLPQPSCGPCTQDADCGNTPSFSPPGFCLPLDGGSFCVPEEASDCSGFLSSVATPIDAGLVLCVPTCDTCPCVGGCHTDADCKAIDAGVCSPSGFCEPPCQAAGCPEGEVCNVLDAYLDPGLTLVPTLAPLYGGGQCGPACTSAASCVPYETAGGPTLTCVADATEPNGDRCRPAGCLDSSECAGTATAPDASYVPWCDVFHGNQCVANACRLGLPTVHDCLGGDVCIDDGGSAAEANGAPATGECVLAPCTVSGADISCPIDNLCCGEGDAGQATCPTGVALGSCYAAPNPPWCAGCDPSISPFGIAACNRSPNAEQFGTGLGTSFCASDGGSGGLCEPGCDRAVAWSCARGFTCTDEVISVSDCSQCGSNPCQAVGSAFNCACVDSTASGCPSQGGSPVACSPAVGDGGNFCSYGTYCQATAHACE